MKLRLTRLALAVALGVGAMIVPLLLPIGDCAADTLPPSPVTGYFTAHAFPTYVDEYENLWTAVDDHAVYSVTLRPGQMFYGLLSTGGNEFVWM